MANTSEEKKAFLEEIIPLAADPSKKDEIRLDELQKLRITRSFQADVLECFMFEIKAIDTTLPLEFTDRFWNNLIDRVTVYHNGVMVFRFKDGTEVTETL